MNEEFRINLKKFDMTNLKSDSVIMMVAKRNSGKSVLVRDIMFHKRGMPVGVVISPTEKLNKTYGGIIPDSYIYDKYTPDIVNRLMLRQEKMLDKMEKNTKIDPSMMLVFDDCLADKKWVKDDVIRSLFMNGRHYKMTYILTMQYSLGIPPELRSNIDYIFILRENFVNNRRRLHEHYAGMFPTFDLFEKAMRKCTADYGCLVIDNTTKSQNIEDQVFWYKASIHPSFRLGSPKFWKFHDKNNNSGQKTIDKKKSNEDHRFFKKNKDKLSIQKVA
jgi:hypothetical protein